MTTPTKELLGAGSGVYIHVPYCRLVCPYCDFVKRGAPNGIPDQFIDALCDEIEAYEGRTDALSIFFGGGTPSMLSATALGRILDALSARFQFSEPEISLEANPDDVTEESLADWRALGITRLSLGVQSFDDATLRYLGRIHDGRHAREACERVSRNFEEWGIDLIFGGGSAQAWGDSLAICADFEPPHVSTYGLTFEEGTPFWKRRNEAIPDDESLVRYRDATAVFSAYEHYEVSNFARAGHESIHNRIYWRNEEYAGFGPGAYTFLDGVRSRNRSNIARYIRVPREKEERLNLDDRETRVETLIQHFRTRSGLDQDYYATRFGGTIEEDFALPVAQLVERGLLERDSAGYRPTRTGYELNDEIGLALV